MSKFIRSLFLLIFFSAGPLSATPETSMLSGLRCSECHLNYQGGGMRNKFGRTFGRDISYFQPASIGLKELYGLLDKKDYGYFDGKLEFGADFRLQTARSPKSPDSERKIFPMQAALNLYAVPNEWLTLEGSYNFGPLIFPGQKEWSASAFIKPAEESYALRVGFFQPSIGVRNCDMTSLDRRFAAAAGANTLIPPNYAEYGAEFIYESVEWLTVNAGVFDSKNLSANKLSEHGEKVSIVDHKGNPSFLLRFVLWPVRDDDLASFGMIGASAYVNGDFMLVNGFGGLAVLEDLFIFMEYAFSKKDPLRQTDAAIARIVYMPLKGIFFGIRAETGKTSYTPIPGVEFPVATKQAALYANIHLAPYIMFIPEYRLIQTEEYAATRWSLQFYFHY